ncbi:tetratricopeptide repeat protein [Nocardia sp. NPDC057030]|uniref:caspase, EACC1-associated type n=1 Tax=unclassified Nocardia TaxID=2637762 RepID=UPI00363CC74D
MTSAPTRSRWRAVLVGVSQYDDIEFPDIPAALNNVADLERLLTAPAGGGLAENHCHVLTNPDSTEVGLAVGSAVREAEDVLLVYYAGHGVVDRRGQLYLALPGSNKEQPKWSSVPFSTLRDDLVGSRARTRILILDCCFSGRAFEAMSTTSTLVQGQIDIQGTYTIASSARTEPSVAPEGHRHTAFTAALLSAAANPDLTLDELYRTVDQILLRNGYPRPQRRSVNVAGDLRLFTTSSIRPVTEGTIAASTATPTDSPRETFERGKVRAEAGDLPQAEILWRSAALQGHTGAMNNLANLLHTQKKIREAHDWWRKAAEQGNAEAMGNLANLLHEIKHFGDAESWWRRAADVGNTDAMYNLAIMLDKSMLFDDALTWYRHAAEAGHPDAMHNLAIRLRYRGQLPEAATWWQRAGHKRAQRANEKLRGLTSKRQS